MERRDLLRGTLAATLSAALPAAAYGAATADASIGRASKPLDLLFLGGTGFLGQHQVEYALARGHRVTLFNRGRSAAAPYGGRAEVLIGDRDDAVGQGLSALRGTRRWDAVIDNSGYVPRHVRDAAALLRDRVRRYVFVSTVAVYDPAAGTRLDEGSPLRASPSEFTEDVNGSTYGPLKADCERALAPILGERATIVRPTFVFGPGDDTDRFTYWVDRVARGGEVLGPSSPDRELTWVDARDLCPWTISLAERDITGTFNASGPVPPTSWREVLSVLAQLSAEPVRFRWATPEVLASEKLELPLFSPNGPSRHFVSDAAQQAGLRYRPLADTATATLAWWRAQTQERRAQAVRWPTAAQERSALARLAAPG